MATIDIKKRDIIWAYVGSFFKVATNILLLPIILKFLDNDELGLWYVFASLGQLAILLDFGFAATLSRNISYVWVGSQSLQKQSVSIVSTGSDTNPEYFKLVLDTCKLIYFVISSVALLTLVSIGLIYIQRLTTDSSSIIAYLLYSFGVFFNLLYSYYTSFLRGVGAVAENNIAGVVSKASQILISILLLLLGYGLLGVSIAYFVSGLLLRIVSKVLFARYGGIKELLKDVSIENKHKKEWDLFKIIWHNASKDGLVTISNFLSTQANTLICSGVLGLSTTGSYGLSVQIATIAGTIAGIPYTTYHPKLQEKAANKDITGSRSILSGSIILYFAVFLILIIALYLMMPVIHYLKPSLEINWSMFLVVMIYMFIHQLYHLAASFISTTNTLPYTNAFIISSVISIFASYLLALYSSMGLWALILAPLAVALCYNAWKWPKYTLNMLEVSVIPFLREGVNVALIQVKNIIYKK